MQFTAIKPLSAKEWAELRLKIYKGGPLTVEEWERCDERQQYFITEIKKILKSKNK